MEREHHRIGPLSLVIGTAAMLIASPALAGGGTAPSFYGTNTPTGNWFVSTVVDPSAENAGIYPFSTSNFTQAVGAPANRIANVSSGSNGPNVGYWSFFVFRQTFDLTGFDPATARLTLQWSADDSGEIFAFRGSWIPAYRLNGGGFVNYPGSTSSARIPTYSLCSPFTIETGFVAGLNTLDFYVEGNGITDGLTVVVTSFTADPISCSADINGDGAVDAADLSLLLANWSCTQKCAGDVNGDGSIDAADLSELLVAWGPC